MHTYKKLTFILRDLTKTYCTDALTKARARHRRVHMFTRQQCCLSEPNCAATCLGLALQVTTQDIISLKTSNPMPKIISHLQDPTSNPILHPDWMSMPGIKPPTKPTVLSPHNWWCTFICFWQTHTAKAHGSSGLKWGNAIVCLWCTMCRTPLCQNNVQSSQTNSLLSQHATVCGRICERF